MLRYLILFASSLFISMNANATSKKVRWISSDVRLITDETARTSIRKSQVTDCREQIKKSVCLVEPEISGHEGEPRKCLPGAEKYVDIFQAHYDRSEPILQKMYCHLDKIYVEKSFYATAYASLVEDAKGRPIAGLIGVRQSFLDEPVGLTDWLSWKEQTTFGAPPDHMETFPEGPHYHGLKENTHERLLDYILAHEFGHLFAFANLLVTWDDCRYEQKPNGDWSKIGSCTPKPGTFSEISWRHVDFPRLSNDYALRTSVCFYSCRGKTLPLSKADDLFGQLFSTNFASTYGSTSAHEDFAESFALLLAHDSPYIPLTITAGEETFSVSEHFLSPALAGKREYLRRWMARGVKYPGE